MVFGGAYSFSTSKLDALDAKRVSQTLRYASIERSLRWDCKYTM